MLQLMALYRDQNDSVIVHGAFSQQMLLFQEPRTISPSRPPIGTSGTWDQVPGVRPGGMFT